MFADSPLTAVVFGVLLGAVLLSIGTAVASNWRGWGERYTDWIDDLLPTTRRSMAADRRPRLLVQNRIIFGVFAAFGIGLLVAGIVTLSH